MQLSIRVSLSNEESDVVGVSSTSKSGWMPGKCSCEAV
jgi:hypothetical protein